MPAADFGGLEKRRLVFIGHDSGAPVGVIKQAYQVGLASLLQSRDGGALEEEIRLEVLGDLTDQVLEGELADEQIGGLLASPDLTESHYSWPVSVGVLDSTEREEQLIDKYI